MREGRPARDCRRTAPRRVAALAATLLLAACSSGATLETYDLSAAKPPTQNARRDALRVGEPTATIDLDSDRILVRAGPRQLARLAGAKWPDRLPVVLRARVIQSLQNAGLLGDAGDRPSAQGGNQLDLDIRKFDLDVAGQRVEIEIAAKILAASGRIVAAQAFSAQSPVASSAPDDVVAAMNGALSSLLTRIVAFAAAAG